MAFSVVEWVLSIVLDLYLIDSISKPAAGLWPCLTDSAITGFGFQPMGGIGNALISGYKKGRREGDFKAGARKHGSFRSKTQIFIQRDGCAPAVESFSENLKSLL